MKRDVTEKLDAALLRRLYEGKLSHVSRDRISVLVLCKRRRSAACLGRSFNVRANGEATPFLAFEATAAEILSVASDPMVLAVAEDVSWRTWPVIQQGVRPANDRVYERYKVGPLETLSGDGVRVLVADTGFSPHPDIEEPVEVVDVTGGKDGRDFHGHGTFIAGQLLARGPYPGLCPGAELIAVKIFDSNDMTSRSRIISALDVAASSSVDVVSMSFGGPLPDPITDAVLSDLAARGVVLVASAGNEGPAEGTISFPGGHESVLAVGAITFDGELADFSSRGWRGQSREKPDFVAEGVDLVSLASPDGRMGRPVSKGYVQASGTSFSAPVAAAIVCLFLERYPGTRAEEVREALRSCCEPVVV